MWPQHTPVVHLLCQQANTGRTSRPHGSPLASLELSNLDTTIFLGHSYSALTWDLSLLDWRYSLTYDLSLLDWRHPHNQTTQPPEMTSLKGLSYETATISLVGHHLISISFMLTLSVMKKYQILMCLVFLPLDALPFLSNRMELLLSCCKRFWVRPHILEPSGITDSGQQ